MPATPTCQPWCTEHGREGEDECFSQIVIWDNGKQDSSESSAAHPEGSMAAMFHSTADMPKEVDWINLIASQDEEDEEPIMHLQLFEASDYQPVATVFLDSAGLKQIQSRLGAIIGKLGLS